MSAFCLFVCVEASDDVRSLVCVCVFSESDTNAAFWKFNARWYGGRQLTCQLFSIPKWKSAICGLFFSNKCPKGKECNFMHVFRNPANEFYHADRDFEPTYRTVDSAWRRKHLRRSRSRSRSWRSRSRCRRSGSRCRRSGRKKQSSSHRSKSKHRSQSPSRGSTTERSRSPRHSSNSPNHGSRLPRHDSTSHRSRSPQYRSRSPRYRSRSPRYRSRSPIYRCRSPRHRVDSPTHRCRLPRDRSMSPGHRFRSPKEISQTLQATYSKKETNISQSPSVHQHPMKRTGTSPDKAAAISATLLPSDKDTCSELLSPVMSKSVPDNSSAECQQATELCCGKDKVEKHKKSKHKKSSKKKKRRKEKRVIENSLHHGCSNRYESAGGDDVGEDGERVDIEDE